MSEDAGSIYSEIRIRLSNLQGDVNQAVAQIKDMGTKIDQQSKAAGDALGKNVATGAEKAGKAIMNLATTIATTAAFKAVIGTFAETEQSLKNVQSVTGATGADFEKLKQAAIDAGQNTRASMKDASDAMYALGSAGLNATQVTQTLNAVLLLAGATQSDVTTTSEVLAATLSQFGLAATESGRVADVFSNSIASSQANMEKLSIALRQVGPVAGTMGISLEEVTASLDALFNSGFQGEQAGTALRNVLSLLANEASPTVAKLEALGIAYDDINPEKVGLTGAIATLGKASISAGDLISAFGEQSGPQLLSLLKVGAGGLEDLQAKLSASGTAAAQNAIQNDTLSGSFDKMSAKVGVMTNSLVEKASPALRFFTDLIGSLANFVTSLPAPLQAGIVGFLGIGAAFVTAASGARLLGLAISTSFPLIGVITAAATALAFIIGSVAANQKSGEQIAADYAEAQTKLVETIQDNADAASKVIGPITDLTANQKLNAQQVAELIKLYPDLNGKIQANVTANKDAADAIRRVAVEQARNGLNQAIQQQTDLRHQIDSVSASLAARKKKFEDAAKAGIITKEALESNLKNDGYIAQYSNQLSKLGPQLSAAQVAQKGFSDQINRLSGNSIQIFEKDPSELLKTATEHATELDQELAKINAGMKIGAIQQEDGLTQIIKLRQDEIDRINNAAIQVGKFADGDLSRRNQLIALNDKDQKAADKIAASKKAAADAAEKALKPYEALSDLYEKLNEQTNDREDAQIAANDADRERIEALAKLESRYTESGLQERLDAIETRRSAELDLADTLGASAATVAAINAKYDQEIADAHADMTGRILKDVSDMVSRYVDAFTNIFSALKDLVGNLQKTADDALDDSTKAQEDALDDQTEARLEAAGVAEESDVEKAQNAVDIAQAALDAETDATQIAADQETLIEAQKELTKQQILQDAADKKAAIDADAAKKKAQLDYNYALTAWGLDVLTATAKAAEAVVAALASPPYPPLNTPFVVAAGIAGGIQVAATLAAKPQPPKLATGGLVIPATSGGVQAILAENGSPELALNGGASGRPLLRQFAQAIAAEMGGGNQPASIVVMMDRQIIAQASVDAINKGQVRLRVQ